MDGASNSKRWSWPGRLPTPISEADAAGAMNLCDCRIRQVGGHTPLFSNPIAPIARPAVTVRNSDDLDLSLRLAEDDEVRKPPEQRAPRTEFEIWEPVRKPRDLLDRPVEFVQKTGRCSLASLPIPLECRLGLGRSDRIKNDRLTSHCLRRARKRRCTSCQGISCAAPLSIS